MTTESYQWTVESRVGYPLIQELAISPDGRRIVYVVREPLMTDDRSEFISHLYRVSPGDVGDEPVQLTFGEHRNTAPRWSPDGRYLAFLSQRSGKTNVYAMRADGGEAWALTKYDKTDVGTLEWSPDGRRIAILMPEPPSEEKEKSRKARDDAKRWDVEFDFAHVFVVPFHVGPRTPPAARQITRGRFQVFNLDWTPDGERIAFAHRPNPTFDTWMESRLSLVDVVGVDGGAAGEAGEPREVAHVADGSSRALVSPDGRWIACHTSDGPAHWALAGRVVLYATDGAERRPLASTPDGKSELFGWAPDGSAVYALDSRGTSSQIWALPAAGEPGRQLTDTSTLKSLAKVNRGGTIAFVGQDFHEPNGVYVLDTGVLESAGASEQRVAQPPLPEGWPTSPLPPAEVLRWRAPDGLEVEGMVVYPQAYQEGKRYPLVLQVHGGPAGVYQRAFLGVVGHGDVGALTERGVAVLRVNPRGSSGYGREFRFANRADWGGGDYQDIMAGVDLLVDRGLADPQRLGIVGWSYGGYMTSWTITQTHRFKAACVGAGVTNLVSFNGTSDIPGFIPDYFCGEFWDDLDLYRRRSPVHNAKGVTTPTLIQHGEDDIRVPLSQGRELYNALQRQGVTVEMVTYPRQGHGVDEPRLVMDVARRATAWIARWLLPGD